MESVLFGDADDLDRASMIERVATYAQRYYRDDAPEDELARWAAEAVIRLWVDGITVKAFVPMLALREVRQHVVEARAVRTAG